MSVQKKSKVQPATAAVTQVEAESEEEIEQIMSEIEELQAEMAETVTTMVAKPKLKVVPQSVSEEVENGEEVEKVGEENEAESQAEDPQVDDDILKEFQSEGSSEVSMEETLANLRDDEAEPHGPTILDTVDEIVGEENFEEQVVSDHEQDEETMAKNQNSQSSEDGTLSMTLTGNMTLKLKYEFDGQEVTVGFSDHSLQVMLADGTEFKIPVRRQNVRKAA